MPVITTRRQTRHTRHSARQTIFEPGQEIVGLPPEGIITEDDSPSPPGDILIHSEPDAQMVVES
jgi:hypothetical protein